jgi:hypothetical protein
VLLFYFNHVWCDLNGCAFFGTGSSDPQDQGSFFGQIQAAAGAWRCLSYLLPVGCDNDPQDGKVT